MARRDRIAEFVERWRDENPGEPFLLHLKEAANNCARVLRSRPLREIGSWLAECKSKKIALERKYGYPKSIFSPYSDQQEDWEYYLCEAFIPRLELELERRQGESTKPNGIGPSNASLNSGAPPEPELIFAQPSPTASRIDAEVAKRRALVKANPGLVAREMCELFDRKQVPLPQPWQDAGFHSWIEAYQRAEYRRRIRVLISKDRKTR